MTDFSFQLYSARNFPPLTDVLITGNLVHSVGEPRYRYDVIISTDTHPPQGLHFSNNLFPPGTSGVCNQELPK